MNQRNVSLPPFCEDCGHRASLHHSAGCRALLLGARTRNSRTCGCTTTLREILAALGPEQPAELRERSSHEELAPRGESSAAFAKVRRPWA